MQVPFSTPMSRVMALPASPSVSALTTGTPPATAASKRSATPAASAASASAWPWRASIALFAVTRCLPPAIAASAVARAGPSSPPITSTTRSTSARRASATGSSSQA